jgi:hypothetical protein
MEKMVFLTQLELPVEFLPFLRIAVWRLLFMGAKLGHFSSSIKILAFVRNDEGK